MEYLEESLDEWLGDELEAFGEDDYVVFDCPGQIELYTNTSVFRSFVRFLQAAGWQASNKRLISVPTTVLTSSPILKYFIVLAGGLLHFHVNVVVPCHVV